MEESQDILQRALELALAIYRLTDRLPKNEVMKGQLRKVSNELVGDLMMDNLNQFHKKIKLLLIYFKISKAQNWVRDINWLILENEYQKLDHQVSLREEGGEIKTRAQIKERGEIYPRTKKHIIESHKIKLGEKIHELAGAERLSGRQRKILEELKVKESIKMSDLIPLFKNTASERTIRNDLQFLLKEGFIGKTGTHKTTVYFLK